VKSHFSYPPRGPAAPLLGTGLAFAGALLSGVMYWAAFAGVDAWPFAFLAFGPLVIALRGQTPGRAFALGTVAGTTMNVLGFYWLLDMLQTFSGFPTAACIFFLLVVCAYQGTRVGAMGWLYARATQRGWPALPVLLGAFVASELAYPLLFPWYFAATVHKVPAFMQIAELGGPVLVGLMLLGANLAIFEPLLARLERRPTSPDVIAAGVAGVVGAILFAAVRIPQVEASIKAAPAATVGIVQGNMGLLQKREDPAEGLRRHIEKTADLKARGVDFVVWSESSVTFPVREESYKSFLRSKVSDKLKLPAIFGGVLYRVDPDRPRWFNVALSSAETGELNGRYDKEYLLQFGEHLPFGDTFPILYKWSPNSGAFSPGTKLDPLTLVVGGVTHRIAALICYEDIIPGFANALVNATQPDLLVNITNDAWFGATTEPWEHLALAQLRAVEHRRYLVRSVNSGVSAVVDPTGQVVTNGDVRDVQHGSYKDADTLVGTIHWMNGRTVYEAVGDVLWWMVTAMMGVIVFMRRTGGAGG
jgi:apolipoprotein N-acyltransferase